MPPILAAIGGVVGAMVLMVLAGVSAVRFWRTDRRIVAGNVLIVAGTASPASGGTLLAVTGRTWGLAVSLAGAGNRAHIDPLYEMGIENSLTNN